jgi:hypothetical protein
VLLWRVSPLPSVWGMGWVGLEAVGCQRICVVRVGAGPGRESPAPWAAPSHSAVSIVVGVSRGYSGSSKDGKLAMICWVSRETVMTWPMRRRM